MLLPFASHRIQQESQWVQLQTPPGSSPPRHPTSPLIPLWLPTLCLYLSITPAFRPLKFKSGCAQSRMPLPCRLLDSISTARCPVEASAPHLLPRGSFARSSHCHLLPVPTETSSPFPWPAGHTCPLQTLSPSHLGCSSLPQFTWSITYCCYCLSPACSL